MVTDDDDLIPHSPLPLFAGHVIGVLIHLSAGISLAAMLLFGPALHPMMDQPVTQTRFWLAGIAGFSTIVAVFFSTIAALAFYRLVSLFFARTGVMLVRVILVLCVFLAHGIGCTAGLVGSGAAVFGTVFGEHGNPWTPKELEETATPP